jgi:hypothetical protein
VIVVNHGDPDPWIAAINAFPDVRPLAELLRSGVPIDDATRHLLAEMIDPGFPPLSARRFELKPNKKFKKAIGQFLAAGEYEKKRKEGITSEIAAEEAGAQMNVGSRSVHRYRKVLDRYAERLGLRVAQKPE